MASTPPTLGTRIRRARERARLSQQELADAVGASKRAVGDWENNRRTPRNRLSVLEDVLGEDFSAPEEPEEKPSPEELNDLRDHIRKVLPADRAARMIAALDAEFGNSLK